MRNKIILEISRIINMGECSTSFAVNNLNDEELNTVLKMVIYGLSIYESITLIKTIDFFQTSGKTKQDIVEVIKGLIENEN